MNSKPLLHINRIAPPTNLLERVLTALYQRQERSRLWRVRIFAASALLSVAALIPAGIGLVNAFKASNFGTYASLIFSDGAVALSYWKEMGASLAESLPVISLSLALIAVGILLWSIQKMVRFMNNNNLRTI